MNGYKYTWKIGVELAANRLLETAKPLADDVCLADLYTGHKYLVQKVFEAKSIDKAFPEMPDTAIQTWPVGTLTDDELNALRQRAMYTPGQFSRPFEAIVFSW
jgi:hypothetical protein